jgi:hypothetical protein
MKLHRNARTCPNSRRLLVERVLRQGWFTSRRPRTGAKQEAREKRRVRIVLSSMRPLAPSATPSINSRPRRTDVDTCGRAGRR